MTNPLQLPTGLYIQAGKVGITVSIERGVSWAGQLL